MNSDNDLGNEAAAIRAMEQQLLEMLRKPVAILNWQSNHPGHSEFLDSTSIPQEEAPLCHGIFPDFSANLMDIKIRTLEDLKADLRVVENAPPVVVAESDHPVAVEKNDDHVTIAESDHPVAFTTSASTSIVEKPSVRDDDISEVVELGNLLSKLPELSRQQKVEEFAFNTLKPPSPVTEAESETSMIPQASSVGTLGTSRATSSLGRPDTGDGCFSREKTDEKEEEDDLVSLATEKMSIGELITLGRKIYRILSQLSNTHTSLNLGNKILATAGSVNPTQTSSLTNNNNNNVTEVDAKGHSKSKSATNTTIVRDFNEIPPSFVVAGPAVIHQHKSSPSMRSSKPGAVLPPINEKQSQSRVTRKNSLQNPQVVRTPRAQQLRRSISSLPSNVASTSNSKTDAKSILKFPERPRGASKVNDSFSVHERYAHNPTDITTRQLQRQVTPVDDLLSNTNLNVNRPKRNFIQENISRIRKLKKTRETRLRPKPLPPVSKKRYANVQSVIGSRSRSRERQYYHEPRSEEHVELAQKRSTSLPAPARNVQRVKSPLPEPAPSGYNTRSRRVVNTPIPPPSPRPSTSRSMDSSTRTQTPIAGNSYRNVRGGPSHSKEVSDSNFRMRSKDKLSISHKGIKIQSGSLVAIVGGNSGSKIAIRKSRSKTRRGSGGNKDQDRNYSGSSINITVPQKRRSKQRVLGSSTAIASSKRNSGQITSRKSEKRSRRFTETPQTPPLSPPSAGEEEVETELIQQIVKTEIDTMVRQHLHDDNSHHTRHSHVTSELIRAHNSRKNSNQEAHEAASDADETVTAVDSESLAPVYSPPRKYDESLFSLENWLNPEGMSAVGNSLTTSKRNSSAKVVSRTLARTPTVRFNLPNHAQQKQ